jgi:hypothetical protein
MSFIKPRTAAAALALVAIAVSAQTYALIKIRKPADNVEARWPQVSIRETLEYLNEPQPDVGSPAPFDREGNERFTW